MPNSKSIDVDLARVAQVIELLDLASKQAVRLGLSREAFLEGVAELYDAQRDKVPSCD